MNKLVFIMIFALLSGGLLTAQEGMWLLTQIDDLNLEEKGLEIATNEIYNPDKPALYNAIVQLGGGTASFVSADGLLITNHHVAFGALQRASSSENDYMTDGFLARDRADEMQAPGYEARLLMEMKDVTDEVNKAVKGVTDPTEKDKLINEKIYKMSSAIEKKSEDVDVYIAEMYNGMQYIQYVYKVFKDIRVVYAPPGSIGNYGGDIDNWMWPRHTGDFSFLRVYATPDGNGAAYSEDNVPYKPEVWLKVANDDLDDGDLTFIMGFPGATTRYRTSNSARWNLEYNYPGTIKSFNEIIDIMDALTKDDPEGKIKVAGMRSGLANTEKNYRGKVEGMKKTHYVKKKMAFEKEFLTWVNEDPARVEKYAHILPDIEKLYVRLAETRLRDDQLDNLQGLSGGQLGLAGQVYMIAKEMEKPKSDRKPGYSEKNVEKAVSQLQYRFMGYYEPVDKAMFAKTLREINELPEGQRIEELQYVFDDYPSVDAFVEKAYAASSLDDLEYAKTLFSMSSKELEALGNPFIDMMASLYPLIQEYGNNYSRFGAEVTELRKEYISALYEWKGADMYPDANGTLRFTSGPVKGYEPEDAVWYKPFTSLRGVLMKNTGENPFDAPDGLVKLYKKQDFGQWMDPDLADVPVAFLHQCDITGGNSGSPVMNAKGEIIGVAFDGNYEAMISDWQYDPRLQRTISVDIRYVLFVTEKFADAGFILDEMGVERKEALQTMK